MKFVSLLQQSFPMGNRKISVDVKLAAIHLYEQGILELHEIPNCVGFSPISVYLLSSQEAL